MDMPARDGDGYLVDMNAWEPEVGMQWPKPTVSR